MKILIVGPAWVGDMVMAQVLFKELRRNHPGAIIDVLAPDWSRPLLDRMPEVRRAIAMPVGHGQVNLSVRKKIAQDLKPEQYDQAILLPNSFKSALIPYWAGIPKRTGWRGEMRYIVLNDIRKLIKHDYPLMIQRFAALAYEKNAVLPSRLLMPELQIDPASRQAAMDKFNLLPQRKILALAPGAEFGEAKRWPEEHYAKAAHALIDDGWETWIFGSKNDVPVANNIRNALPVQYQVHCHILAGQTSLAEAIDLLSMANMVICNDSGLMHIAAALGRPLVAVYGSTSPDFTPPLNDHVRIVRLGLDCSPCFERVCPLGHTDCLKKLDPEKVLDAVTELNKEMQAIPVQVVS
ncbi:MAG TPA: lipopolysaccharide heptosyltransferase II [Pseudomonadales bacterium]|nr:lipopolysaccharide heptosyltransferase II [Pseudomonadales bacterium]